MEGLKLIFKNKLNWFMKHLRGWLNPSNDQVNLIKSIIFLQKYLIGTDKILIKPDNEKMDNILHSLFDSLLFGCSSFFNLLQFVVQSVLRLTKVELEFDDVEGWRSSKTMIVLNWF